MTIEELSQKHPGTFVGSDALRSLPKLNRNQVATGRFSGTIAVLDFPIFGEEFIVQCKDGEITDVRNYGGYRSAPNSLFSQGTESETVRNAKEVADLVRVLPEDADLRAARADSDLFSVELPQQIVKVRNFSGELGYVENFDRYNRKTNMWFARGKLVYIQSAVEESKLMD
jgi:hypothetical protein